MSFAALATELAKLDTDGRRRFRRTLQSPQQPRVIVDGREYVAFCSNDYLGLAGDARLIRAAQDGAAKWGVGSGASHLILGHTSAHHKLEGALAAFVGLPRALLFSSGYLANIAVVTALMGRDDAVFADRLNHASLNDAVLLSRATFKRYAHGDVASLEKLLAECVARHKLIVTDAVFSMDGDIAPLPDLLALCERYDAWLFVDDAHGFGVLGTNGRGSLSHCALASPRIVYMATLGKAAGVSGAFVAGEPDVVETLVQRARPYIYTTAAPALLAHVLLTSVKLIEAESWRRDRLRELITLLKQGLQRSPWRLLPSDTAIQPLVIGDNRAAMRLSEELRKRSVLVPAIRPPTVPAGTARLRISLSAAHEPHDVEVLVDALTSLA